MIILINLLKIVCKGIFQFGMQRIVSVRVK
jgi:hypothetical protein